MVEQELPAVEQGPEEVGQALLLVLLGAQQRGERLKLLLRGLPAEGAEVELGDPLLRGLRLGDQPLDDAPLGDLAVDGRAVEQVQGLRERRLQLDLARADRFTLGSAKRRQEVRAGVAVGNLHGVGAQRETLKFIFRIGDLADAVQHHLGVHSTDVRMSEISFVGFVAGSADRAALVGLRIADVTYELFEVIFVFHELLSAGLLVRGPADSGAGGPRH